MNRAAGAIGSPPTRGQPGRQRRTHAQQQAYVIPPGGNDLKGTDAPTYRVSSGASISVSGRLIQGPGATCVHNCRNDPAGAAPPR
jgi:hypothetical protein